MTSMSSLSSGPCRAAEPWRRATSRPAGQVQSGFTPSLTTLTGSGVQDHRVEGIVREYCSAVTAVEDPATRNWWPVWHENGMAPSARDDHDEEDDCCEAGNPDRKLEWPNVRHSHSLPLSTVGSSCPSLGGDIMSFTCGYDPNEVAT